MSNVLFIFIAIIGYIVIKQLITIYQNYQCFEDDVLDDYFHGRLKREETLRRQVVTHLGLCEKCQKKMFDLQSGKDQSISEHLVD